MDDVIKLISSTKSKNEYGVWEETYSENQVLCQVKSITRQEFFEGGRVGLNPSFVFTVFAGDYSEESICQYKDKQYSIYRTYIVPDTDYIELYVERKGGTNKKAEVPDGNEETDRTD